jgi:hypothetical protein
MKKEVVEKWSERVEQRISLILGNPYFKKDLILLREKFDIPQKGFDTTKEQWKWEKEVWAKQEKYYRTEGAKHWQELEQLLKKDPLKYKARQDEINSLAPHNRFKADLAKLIIKYKLSHRDIDMIEPYVYYNNPPELRLRLGPSIETTFDPETDQRQIKILIDANTTISDIKTIWPNVMIHQKSLSYRRKNKVQPIPNLKMYKRAYELDQEGKTAQKVAEILNDEFKGVTTVGYNDIADYLKRYKKHTGMN